MRIPSGSDRPEIFPGVSKVRRSENAVYDVTEVKLSDSVVNSRYFPACLRSDVVRIQPMIDSSLLRCSEHTARR